jgi:hypothetical protein
MGSGCAKPQTDDRQCEVHGIQDDLADRDITLHDDQTREPLGVNPATSLLINQAGFQSQL